MNRYLWPFPVFCGNGKPIGDGIYWPTNRPKDKGSPEGKAQSTARSDSAFDSRRGSGGERAADRRNQANKRASPTVTGRKSPTESPSPNRRFGKLNHFF